MLWPTERGNKGLRGIENSTEGQKDRDAEKGREVQSDNGREVQRRARESDRGRYGQSVRQGWRRVERDRDVHLSVPQHPSQPLTDTAHICPCLTLSALF